MAADVLYESAKIYLDSRFPMDAPWVGASAAKTKTGEIFTSTGFNEVANESARLCHETGVICEAYSRNTQITDILCLSRNDKGVYEILPPCGICLERLMFWGGGINVAVPCLPSTTDWRYIKLSELHPYYWFKPYENGVSL